MLRLLWNKRYALLYVLLCGACCALVFWGYRVRLDAVAYALLLCAAIGAAFLALGAVSQHKKRLMLRHMRQNLLAGDLPLPTAGGAMEAEYQALVRALLARNADESARHEQAVREMRDDYTLWAHQIKTPIAAMRLLLTGREDEDARELSMELLRVEEYVEMALSMQRLTSDGNDFVLRACDLDDIVKKAVRKYSKAFIRRRLRLEYQPLNARALTDEKWLLFIIEQILSNAIKYTPSGSVHISLESPKTLVIADTGIGISPEDLPRVFERGYTGYNGRVENRSTGIGLYLSKKAADKIGHQLKIESEAGRGTRVSIDLDSKKLLFD